MTEILLEMLCFLLPLHKQSYKHRNKYNSANISVTGFALTLCRLYQGAYPAFLSSGHHACRASRQSLDRGFKLGRLKYPVLKPQLPFFENVFG
jgi:hypothetical protein